ncbi:MAG: hypothetical protein ASARMPRED_001892 [Alectoria sarmentosa]|nr:MAG: hypothetical protein ASARMPRED_001892 [Alectoria sarmentosa]
MPISTFPFLSLPQELRDRVYEYDLSATYEHCLPNLSKFPIPPSISKDPYFEDLQRRQYGFLAILLVSNFVLEEAKLIFYKCGTFFFHVRVKTPSPGHSLLNTANLQNIVIDIDLDGIFPLFSPSPCRDGRAKHATALVKHFAQSNTTPARASFVVKVEGIWNVSFLSGYEMGEAKAFVDAIGGLTGFKTVSVKFDQLAWGPDRSDTSWSEAIVPHHEMVGVYLEGSLGRTEAEWNDEELCFCMTFHPRHG